MAGRKGWVGGSDFHRMRDSIQVIIPALDEEATIAGVVAALRAQGLTRIRLVDNGSCDRTATVAREAGAEVLVEPVAGYGRACWRGYRELDDAVEWVLFCDADGSDEPADVARLIAAAEEGADFVLGDRRARPAARAVMTPVQRWGNGLATTLIRWGWGQRYGDLGPLRLIRRSLLEQIAMRDRGFGWTIEMQVRAVEEGARIVELPVGYQRRGGGRSKISGTIRGSVTAGTIILSTIARLWWARRVPAASRYKIGGALVVAGAAIMAPWGDFATAGTVPWFLAAATVMALGWLLAGRPSRIGAGWFWTVAVLARVALLPMAPGDDVWRYLWEGRMQSAGFSPYLHAPADPYLVTWRDEAWALVNHKEFSTIYPPIAQIVLHLIAAGSTSVLAMKLAFVAADLAVAGLLARRFGRGAALAYAWNPLILYTAAGGAHYEPLLLLAFTAGWLAWEPPGQPAGEAEAGLKAGWWLGVATGLKWVTAPLVAWCAWARIRAGRRQAGVWLAVAGVTPVALALLWFHRDFGRIGPLLPADFVKWARTAELGPWLLELVWPGSAFKNGIVLALFAPVAAWIFFRARTLTQFAETFLFALLVGSPSVHPWYFGWLIPLAVATRNRGTLAVSVSGFAYFWVWETQAALGEWTFSPALRLTIWLPLLVGFWWSRRQAPNPGVVT